MWCIRVTVSNKLQDKVLYELHRHPEVVQMKSIAKELGVVAGAGSGYQECS